MTNATENGRDRAQHSSMLGRGTDKKNVRTTQNQTPPSPGGDQRKPSSLAFCSPAPAFFGPGTRRGTPISRSKSSYRDAQQLGAMAAPP